MKLVTVVEDYLKALFTGVGEGTTPFPGLIHLPLIRNL